LQLLRQDAPLISPHTAQLAAEPYRASGLVQWHLSDIANISANVRFREADRTSIGVAELRIVTEFGLRLTEFGQQPKRTV
jgi:hypothetical protein